MTNQNKMTRFAAAMNETMIKDGETCHMARADAISIALIDRFDISTDDACELSEEAAGDE